MTDKEALETLKSVKTVIARGSGKTEFQSIIFEAEMHALKALEEKVNNADTGEWVRNQTNDKIVCSKCRKNALCDGVVICRSNYCPSCGIKMLNANERR